MEVVGRLTNLQALSLRDMGSSLSNYTIANHFASQHKKWEAHAQCRKAENTESMSTRHVNKMYEIDICFNIQSTDNNKKFQPINDIRLIFKI